MRGLFFVLLTALLSLPAAPAWAKCSGPSAAAGGRDFQYSGTGSTENFCDDSDTWKLLREVDDTGTGVRQLIQIGDDTGGCTAAKLGRIRYVDGTDTWHYCDGTNWLVLGPGKWEDGAAGEIYYDTANVGIGLTDPAYALDVSGSIQLSDQLIISPTAGATTPVFGFDLDDLSDAVITTPSNGEVLTYSAGNWVNATGGASVFTDLTDTPADYTGAANKIVAVNGSGNAVVFTTETDPKVGTLTASKWCTTDGSAVNCATDTPGGIPAGASGEVQFNSGGSFGASSNLFWDISNGRLGIKDNTPDVELDVVGDIDYTGVLTDVSDRSLKNNIAPLSNSLKGVLALQGVSFTMKGDESGATEYGLIAQDVEPVFPALVQTKEDGLKTLNYIGLIAPLVEAVKQQQAMIEELRAQNAALQTRLQALEQQKQSGEQ